jgi:hypothetical protein
MNMLLPSSEKSIYVTILYNEGECEMTGTLENKEKQKSLIKTL